MAKFTIDFKDPDLLFDIAQAYPSKGDDSESRGEKWRDKFTEYGDYATIEIDTDGGTFRFLRKDGGSNEDGGAAWHKVSEDTAFAMPFGTVRKCLGCGCLVGGGPTRCGRCAEDVKPIAAEDASS